MNENAQKVKTNRKPRIRSAAKEAAYLALGVAILTVCAWITIPFGTIPVTLQTFAVALIGALLGAVRGVTVVLVYFIMGLIGIPVFSNFNAGVVALLGPTGGYLIGFVFSVAIVGLFSMIPVKNKIAKTATVYGGAVLGMMICYFFGTLWFVTVYNRGGAETVSIAAALMLCVVPYLLPDAVKLFFGALLGVRLKGVVKIEKTHNKKTR
ncbi:MAG: biotin transporter BioY [Clostridia bacterium]|nr:biotin transporter BioY [Clostridia bacterium]